MADIRIKDLPLATGGTAPTGADAVAIDGLTTRKTTISSLGDVAVPVASQAEAEAGSNASKRMTPLTVKQSIASEVGVTLASAANGMLASTALQPGDAATPAQGAKADAALPRNEYAFFDTEALFQSAIIPVAVNAVSTNGYYSAGDGGGHLKKRITTPSPVKAWHKQSADGAWWKISQSVSNPLFFGAVGDGEADDYLPLQAAINYAEKGALRIPGKVFAYSKGLVWPLGNMLIYGDSHNAGVNVGRDYSLDGSVLLPMGTALKEQYALGVTDDRTSGGVINNTADADFGAMDSKFSLASYYNEDANPATGQSATPAPFSAALTFPFGCSGIVMRDIRILLNFDGVAGYNAKTLSLADDWDVGIYMDNCRYCEFENVQVIGYFRKNGLLVRTGAMAREEALNGTYAGAEENKFYNCVFQGWKSVGFRSPGMWRAMAVTSTYIEVLWADNHPFDIQNDARITHGEFSPRNIAISSLQKVGDRLRLFTPVDQTGLLPVGDPIAPPFIGNGVAGTVFLHSRAHGMWHSSGYRISDPLIAGAMPPSACVEISGTRIRGPRFEGCKAQTVDDIGFQLHQCIDVILGPNARFEGSTPTGGLGGIRMISTPSDQVAYPGRVRETFRVQLHSEQPAADFTPSFGNRASKFTTDGFWVPNLCGEIFHGGIFVGDPLAPQTLLREYLVGGFTPVFSFETPGDLAVASQTRAGSVEYCGEWLRFNLRITARLTFTTASGNLRVSLPRAIFNQANMVCAFETSFEGITLPTGKTHVVGEGVTGQALSEFAMTGSNVARQKVQAAQITSGAFCTIIMSGMYRFSR